MEKVKEVKRIRKIIFSITAFFLGCMLASQLPTAFAEELPAKVVGYGSLTIEQAPWGLVSEDYIGHNCVFFVLAECNGEPRVCPDLAPWKGCCIFCDIGLKLVAVLEIDTGHYGGTLEYGRMQRLLSGWEDSGKARVYLNGRYLGKRWAYINLYENFKWTEGPVVSFEIRDIPELPLGYYVFGHVKRGYINLFCTQ